MSQASEGPLSIHLQDKNWCGTVRFPFHDIPQAAWEEAEFDDKQDKEAAREAKQETKDYFLLRQEQHRLRGYSPQGLRSILKNAMIPPSRASTALSDVTAAHTNIKGN